MRSCTGDYSPYALGSPVQIDMFVDRLELSSLGGLYGGVTVGNPGEAGVSSTRNQRTATLLEDVRVPGGGIVAENRGTGIDRMRNAFAEALMAEPIYTNTLSSFTVTFSATARDVVRGHFESVAPLQPLNSFLRKSDSFVGFEHRERAHQGGDRRVQGTLPQPQTALSPSRINQ